MAGRPLRRMRVLSLATFPEGARVQRNPLPTAPKSTPLGQKPPTPLFNLGDIVSYKDAHYKITSIEHGKGGWQYAMVPQYDNGKWSSKGDWRSEHRLVKLDAYVVPSTDASAKPAKAAKHHTYSSPWTDKSGSAETAWSDKPPWPMHSDDPLWQPHSSKPPKPHVPYVPPEPTLAYGVVLINDAGQVLLREPAGHWGGYQWTFAKGGADKGEAGETVALRELLEETGWTATLVQMLPEVHETHGQVNRYYLGKPGALVQPFDKETQAIEWFDEAEARSRIMLTNSGTGRSRDLGVLCSAYRAWERLKHT